LRINLPPILDELRQCLFAGVDNFEVASFDQAASALGMHLALGMLAEGAADSDNESTLRRSAAIVASLGDAVLKGTLRTVATETSRDAAQS
jgi:hypothetical protein